MSVHQREVMPSLLQVDAILKRLSGAPVLSATARFLRHNFPHYRWVGFYRLEGETLVLDGWDGEAETQHVRIPVGEGVCGRAARENRTVIVDDVSSDPDYLSCFLETKSEIVVPIRQGGRVLGEVDVDGTSLKAFDASDGRFLEQVAAKLAATLAALSEPSAPGSPPSP